MAIKPIKIVTGYNFNTDCEIIIDGEDVLKEGTSIFGVDIKLRVGEVPKVTLHQYSTVVTYEGKECDVNYENHKLAKGIAEDTNYSNAENGRHFKKI